MQRPDVGRDPVADHLARGFHRHTVQIRPARRRRGRGVGHFARIRRGDFDLIDTNPEHLRRDLRHLQEQPLSHFGAAMVQHDRAVLIHMHQGTRLIEMGQRKGNPELHGRQCDTALQHRTTRIPCGDRPPPRLIVARRLQFVGQSPKDKIRDRHPVGRHVLFLTRSILGGGPRGTGGRRPPSLVVVIHLPHSRRVHPQSVRHVIHHPLDADHALRSAEPAKRRGALVVGFQSMTFNTDVGQIIGVVRVQHCAICDGQR